VVFEGVELDVYLPVCARYEDIQVIGVDARVQRHVGGMFLELLALELLVLVFIAVWFRDSGVCCCYIETFLKKSNVQPCGPRR
jgi:hypothetical protein